MTMSEGSGPDNWGSYPDSAAYGLSHFGKFLHSLKPPSFLYKTDTKRKQLKELSECYRYNIFF